LLGTEHVDWRKGCLCSESVDCKGTSYGGTNILETVTWKCWALVLLRGRRWQTVARNIVLHGVRGTSIGIPKFDLRIILIWKLYKESENYYCTYV